MNGQLVWLHRHQRDPRWLQIGTSKGYQPKPDDLTAVLLERTMASGFFVRETPIERYGLTPLHVAPAPDRNPGIDPALIERHLDFLMSDQADDGGWPIRFNTVSPGAEIEWRGYFTAEAIRTLEAYGRI